MSQRGSGAALVTKTPTEPTSRCTAHLVAGGRYHDIDFARRELLALLAEHDHVRSTVSSDWEDLEELLSSDFIISYTCDVRPSEEAQHEIRSWLSRGGRLVALHGTNAALDLEGARGIEAPRCFPDWAEALGSQFVAHPPIAPYLVEMSPGGHWLTAGIAPFEVDDELYLMEYPDRDSLESLIYTRWQGEAPSFAESDWRNGPEDHLVQYLRPLEKGAVLYNTLGHCRGHWDMLPISDWYPHVERCSWDLPQYRELLRRAIRWAMGCAK